MAKYYSGVGSRETPLFVCQAMTDIAAMLRGDGYVLRSGHADGADMAFENGSGGIADIYLHKKGFNGSRSLLYNVGEDAIAMALSVHPAPKILSLPSKRNALLLHARNCYQVLGDDLQTPSDFVLAWTQYGELKGGTRTALVLAERNNIPSLNFGRMKTYDQIMTAFDIFYMVHGNI